jgi:putative SOS response-associated peptidase YedK
LAAIISEPVQRFPFYGHRSITKAIVAPSTRFILGAKVCGRLTLTTPPQSLPEFLAGLEFPAVNPRFNIAPTQPLLCVVNSHQKVTNAKPSSHLQDINFNSPSLLLRYLSWGLIPAWEKHPAQARRYFNARCETIADKPAFAAAFKQRRCLIFADGFYEWKTQGRTKLPYYFTDVQNRILLLAGLWAPGQGDQSPGNTCTIITTHANELMSPLHSRMPVILSSSDAAKWMAAPPSIAIENVSSLLRPCDENRLKTRPVSTYVNNAAHQGPACLGDPPPQQTSLF